MVDINNKSIQQTRHQTQTATRNGNRKTIKLRFLAILMEYGTESLPNVEIDCDTPLH